MVVPAFGFSVGDFIAGIQIAQKALEALSEAKGASYHYTMAISDLRSLEFVLHQVQALQETSETSKLVQQVQMLAYKCTHPVSRFSAEIKPYEKYLEMIVDQQSERCLPFSLHRTPAKVRWALSTTKAFEEMNKVIAPAVRQIIICLQLISLKQSDQAQALARAEALYQLDRFQSIENTLSRLRDDDQQATLNGSQRKDQFSGELIHINVRKYHQLVQTTNSTMAVPFEYFRHWPTFRSHLLNEFKDVFGIENVMGGGSGVFNGAEIFPSFGRLVLPRTVQWDKVVNPGTTLQLKIVEDDFSQDFFYSKYKGIMSDASVTTSAFEHGQAVRQLLPLHFWRPCRLEVDDRLNRDLLGGDLDRDAIGGALDKRTNK